jgi:hypothetical protein
MLEGLFGSQKPEHIGTYADWDVTCYGLPQDPRTQEHLQVSQTYRYSVDPVEGFVYYCDYQIKIANQKIKHIKTFTDLTK